VRGSIRDRTANSDKRLGTAREAEAAGGVLDRGDAELGTVGGKPHREARDIVPAFGIRQLLRVEPYDIGPVLREDLGEPGDKAELVATAHLDAVGDLPHRPR